MAKLEGGVEDGGKVEEHDDWEKAKTFVGDVVFAWGTPGSDLFEGAGDFLGCNGRYIFRMVGEERIGVVFQLFVERSFRVLGFRVNGILEDFFKGIGEEFTYLCWVIYRMSVLI